MIRERRKTKATDKQAGQGFVEFALILPVLLLLMFGVIEFGRLLFIYTEVSNAAREAVRFGVVRGDPNGLPNYELCEQIAETGMAVTALTALEYPGDFEISFDDGNDETSLGDCGNHGEISLGDRLVVTVSYAVQPLVLFQNAGPFLIEFTTARTIVHDPAGGGGIVMSGFEEAKAGGSDLGVPSFFNFVPDPDYPGGCWGHFEWGVVEQADGYELQRSLPAPTEEIAGNITATRYPTYSLKHEAADGEEYFVRAYRDVSGTPDVSGPSNPRLISCLAAPMEFTVTLKTEDPCAGYFTWTAVEHATDYRLFRAGVGPVGDVGTDDTRYPKNPNSSIPLTNGQVYTVTALNPFGELGVPSQPVTVTGCIVYPPDPPTLSFVTDGTWPPCQGHFTWGMVDRALGYHFYSAGISDTISGTRYPTAVSMSPVGSGETYTVTAYNEEGESDPSNQVDQGAVEAACAISGPAPMAFYLHTRWEPEWNCADHDGYPPLSMDESPPACGLYEYDYNKDADPKGRQVEADGPAPVPWDSGTFTDTYVAWHTDPVPQKLTVSDVTLRLWYINDHQTKSIPGVIWLCRFDGTIYSDCFPTNFTFGKHPTWSEAVVTLSGGFDALDPFDPLVGDRLAVYLVHGGGGVGQPLWFMYDKAATNPPGYLSRIEFMGQWTP